MHQSPLRKADHRGRVWSPPEPHQPTLAVRSIDERSRLCQLLCCRADRMVAVAGHVPVITAPCLFIKQDDGQLSTASLPQTLPGGSPQWLLSIPAATQGVIDT